MSSIFSSILVKKPRRSVFNLSYENKLSLDMGYLVPIYKEHVVPGDKFRVNSEVFLRFAPMLAPVMHRINCYVHYFFVPYRLLWNEWETFITGGEDGLASPLFPRSYLTSLGALPTGNGSLMDYLGYNFVGALDNMPTNNEYSLLPFRAYQFIYNEYYRDQNLTPAVEFSVSSGDSNTTTQFLEGTTYSNVSDAMTALFTLRKRAWEKDYFTSALPFVQRGVASQLPIELNVGNLKITPTGTIYTTDTVIDNASLIGGGTPPGDDIYVRTDGTISTGGSAMALGNKSQSNTGNTTVHRHDIYNPSLRNNVRIEETEQGLSITAPTINELRLAEHIQRWLEKNARGGARYIEQILSHFGVRVPDYRLDRPEYLGGGKSPVQISEVLQTSSTDSTSPQGNMSGHAYAVGSKNKFKYNFDEFGIVLGIMSILPRTSYQQGISRHETKFDKFDYYFPEFAHLGEQAILNQELYNNMYGSDLGDTFGYQERYAEYKYRSGEVHGDFKSSLDFWHLGRKFGSEPLLNTSFVESNPSDRIFTVAEGQHLWAQIYNNVTAVRPMPKHAIPSL